MLIFKYFKSTGKAMPDNFISFAYKINLVFFIIKSDYKYSQMINFRDIP